MYIDHHNAKWEELHQSDSFRPKYPTESVVRFIRMHFPSPNGKRILDLGSGAGRHVVFLAREGFDTTGIDFSENGLHYTERLLRESGLKADLIHGSILSLPFPSDSFDGIVSCGVLCYFVRDDLEKISKEIHRVLKKGSKAFIITRSIHDKRYGIGKKAGEHTFLMTDNETNEESMLMYFLEPQTIHDIFSPFSDIKIGFTAEAMNSLTRFNHDYLITLTK